MNHFGERLKFLRKAVGITQQELADQLGVHLQTVSKWERGISEPDFSLLGDIASVLGVTLERLIGVDEADCTYGGHFSPESEGKALASARKAKGKVRRMSPLSSESRPISFQNGSAALSAPISGSFVRWRPTLKCLLPNSTSELRRMQSPKQPCRRCGAGACRLFRPLLRHLWPLRQSYLRSCCRRLPQRSLP